MFWSVFTWRICYCYSSSGFNRKPHLEKTTELIQKAILTGSGLVLNVYTVQWFEHHQVLNQTRFQYTLPKLNRFPEQFCAAFCLVLNLIFLL